MEPLSVAVHAVANKGQCRANMNVLIMGAGPVGLLAMGVAKGMGARTIVAVDINEERLNFASSYAATHTYIPVSPLVHYSADLIDQAECRRVSTRVFATCCQGPIDVLRYSCPRSWFDRLGCRRNRSRGLRSDGTQCRSSWVRMTGVRRRDRADRIAEHMSRLDSGPPTSRYPCSESRPRRSQSRVDGDMVAGISTISLHPHISQLMV